MGPIWVLSAPDGPQCWPHEPCSLGGPVLLGVDLMVAAVVWDVVVRRLSCVSPLP